MKKNRTIVIFVLLIVLIFGLMLGCSNKNEETVSSQGYNNKDLWLALPEKAEKEVDVFYLYPTTWERSNDSDPYICNIDYEPMRKKAAEVFEVQATAFENTCNIYAPFYRQVDASYCLGLSEEKHDSVMREAPVSDALAAFDYYIKNYNNGRPFILAGHSQGSDVLRYLLSDYMKENPEVYEQMVAAYVIGYSVTEDYMKANPHLKFAEGANDTGVIISYNTEAEEIEGESPVRLPGAIAINPINWKRDGTFANEEENLGELYQHDEGIVQDIIPGYKNARVDVKRGAVICTSVNPDNYISAFPKGVYHGQDYTFYYYNLRANAKERIAAFLGKDYLTNKFVVKTDWVYKNDSNDYLMDVIMPKVDEHVRDCDKINFRLLNYNNKEELKEAQGWDWYTRQVMKRRYSVSNINGICSLNLIYEYKEGNEKTRRTIECYYYDENEGKVITQKQYLKKLGYTEENILELFNEKYAEKYKNRTYDFNNLSFYFDGNNELQFETQEIDNMTVNYADFNLIIGTDTYSLNEKRSLPDITVLDSKVEFISEVWAGSTWLTEYYDGAVAFFSYNKETGDKIIFDLEITPSESTKNITTYRGAKLGDTKQHILSLYPDINPEEQLIETGDENMFSFTDDWYRYMNFTFENDVLIKIKVGTIID